MTDQPEVFISFASRDGAGFAEAVRVRLEQDSPALRLWKDHVSLEGGLKWWPQIQQALDEVRFLVLIVTPCALEPDVAPVVQKELRYAREQGVWIYPVMGAPKDQIPFYKFPRWLEKLTKTTFYDFHPAWPSPWDQPASGHDYHFAHEWDRFVRQLDRPGRPPRVRNTAPTDLPANYVRREAEFEKLRALLLQPDRRSPIAITTTLHGPGGFGKTTLAKDLCRDRDVQEAFDDGILWVTLGEKANVRDALAKLYKELTGETPGFVDEEEAVQQLRPKLEDKDTLIVIDDVWSADHVKPFLEGGARTARLFTTRELTVAAETRRGSYREEHARPNQHDEWVTVDEPAADLAVEILLQGLPARPPEGQIAPYRELAVQRLGRWPLLIALVVAEMRLKILSGAAPEQALAEVNQGLDEEGLTAFEPSGDREETARRRERSARLTINASLKQLDETERQKYGSLAIFPEDEAVPCTTLGALWGLSAYKTRQLAENFGRRSLLKYDPTNHSIRLHDVFRTYLVQNLPDARAAHARLVDCWGDLHNLPDPYAWRHVAHHLIEAGRRDRLRELLLDYRWLRPKLLATDPIALRDDAARFPDDPDLRYLARALSQSAHVLARDPAALRGQLYGRLMAIESPGIRRLVQQIGATADEGLWLRPLRPALTTADSPLLRVLEGHSDGVNAVALSADGRIAVSGSVDKTVRVWDLATGQSRALEGHSNLVNAVALTADGRTAVSGSGDTTVRVWDLATGQSRALEGHSYGVTAVALTADGRTAVSGSSDTTVRVWDLATGQSSVLDGHSHVVNAVALTADGRTAVSGSDDHTVRVWDLATGQSRVLEGHGDWVNAVALSADGCTAVSGSDDKTDRVWDLATGQSRVLEGHSEGVNAVALSANGRTAVSGSSDKTVRVWDLASGQSRVLDGHSVQVTAVALTADGRTAVSGSDDHTVRVWDLATVQSPVLEGHSASVNAVALSADGRTAVSGSRDHTVRVWDLATVQSRVLEGHSDWVKGVALSADGRTAVSGSDDKTVRVWDLATGQSRVLKWRTHWVKGVALSADGRIAVSGSDDNRVLVWDSATGPSRALVGHSRLVNAVALSADGRTAVSGSNDETVRVWDLASGRSRVLAGHSNSVRAVALSADGRTAVSGSNDQTVRVWDLATGQSRVLEGHRQSVNAVAVTPDGRTAVSGSGDAAILVWGLSRNLPITGFQADAPILACAVSDDGQKIVAGDAAGRVHFLKLEQ